MYFDGVAVNTEGVNAAVMQPWENPPTIGCRNLRGVLNGFVDGELDELVFYNYPLLKPHGTHEMVAYLALAESLEEAKQYASLAEGA